MYLSEASLNSSNSGSIDRKCLTGTYGAVMSVNNFTALDHKGSNCLYIYCLKLRHIKVICTRKYIHPESKSEQKLTWGYELCFFVLGTHKLL